MWVVEIIQAMLAMRYLLGRQGVWGDGLQRRVRRKLYGALHTRCTCHVADSPLSYTGSRLGYSNKA